MALMPVFRRNPDGAIHSRMIDAERFAEMSREGWFDAPDKVPQLDRSSGLAPAASVPTKRPRGWNLRRETRSRR